MTWLSTWPEDGRPETQAHASEGQAEAHAETKRATGWPQAVAFWSESDPAEAREAHRDAAQSDASNTVALGSTDDTTGREIGSDAIEESRP